MKKKVFFHHGFIGIDQITTKVHHRVQVEKKLLSYAFSTALQGHFWGKIYVQNLNLHFNFKTFFSFLESFKKA